MYRLEGQGLDGNMFENSFTNDLPRPIFIPFDFFTGSFALAASFLKEGSSPLYLPPTHLSLVNRYGTSVAQNKFPAVLEFRPTIQVQTSEDFKQDYRLKLSNLKPASIMYEIFAKEKRKDKESIKIGELILESELISSKYGDEKLFFQHNIE